MKAHSHLNKMRMLQILRDRETALEIPPSYTWIMDEFGFATIDLARTLIADLVDGGAIRTRPAGPDEFKFEFIGQGVLKERPASPKRILPPIEPYLTRSERLKAAAAGLTARIAKSGTVIDLPKQAPIKPNTGQPNLNPVKVRVIETEKPVLPKAMPKESAPTETPNVIPVAVPNFSGFEEPDHDVQRATVIPRGSVYATQILAKVETFLVEHNMGAQKFGRAAVNDNHLVKQLRREGSYISTGRIERIEAFMAGYQNSEAAQKEDKPMSSGTVLLNEIDEFLLETGIKDIKFSLDVADNFSFMTAFRKSRRISTKRALAIREYMADFRARGNTPGKPPVEPERLEPQPDVTSEARPVHKPKTEPIKLGVVTFLIEPEVKDWLNLNIGAMLTGSGSIDTFAKQLFHEGMLARKNPTGSPDGTLMRLRGEIMTAWRKHSPEMTYGDFATSLVETGLSAFLASVESGEA